MKRLIYILDNHIFELTNPMNFFAKKKWKSLKNGIHRISQSDFELFIRILVHMHPYWLKLILKLKNCKKKRALKSKLKGAMFYMVVILTTMVFVRATNNIKNGHWDILERFSSRIKCLVFHQDNLWLSMITYHCS